ncbi:MAG: hypothetical protein NUV46_03540 [Nanoarchaeota archaeon]|nr:hypothetical protein [Nanoarchaeota archaeon]
MKELSEEVKNEINLLTKDDLLSNYSLGHEILIYGVDSLAHLYIMKKAKENLEMGGPLKDFIEKYSLVKKDLNHNLEGKFEFQFKKIADGGIFIPDTIHSGCVLFKLDYWNRIFLESWGDKEYAKKLIHKRWEEKDFENKEIINQGIKFGKDMWKTCIEGFDEYKNGYEEQIKPQSEKLNFLGQELIDYYSLIINE